MIRELLHVAAWLFAWPATALATTYVVDDTPGPGVDFLDIPPAIAASLPGDVLLIAPGSYSGFTLDRGIVIVGSFGAGCSGPIEVRALPAGQRAAIARLSANSVVVDACSGPVILQSLGTVATLRVTGSADVRVSRTTFASTAYDHLDAIGVSSSRLELVECTVDGHEGTPSTGAGVDGVNGGAGIAANLASRLTVTACSVSGGAGTLETTPSISSGGGGPALALSGASTALSFGPGSSFHGGGGGLNWFYAECGYDAPSASAVVGTGSSNLLIESGTTFYAPLCFINLHCTPYTPPLTSGVTRTTIVPADPALSATALPLPGESVTFTLRGEPGASATLVLGRGLVVEPTPGVLMERLVLLARVFPLGPIPATGEAVRTITLPTTLPHGFVFGAQAEVTGTNGLRRTNSMPIVVR